MMMRSLLITLAAADVGTYQQAIHDYSPYTGFNCQGGIGGSSQIQGAVFAKNATGGDVGSLSEPCLEVYEPRNIQGRTFSTNIDASKISSMYGSTPLERDTMEMTISHAGVVGGYSAPRIRFLQRCLAVCPSTSEGATKKVRDLAGGKEASAANCRACLSHKSWEDYCKVYHADPDCSVSAQANLRMEQKLYDQAQRRHHVKARLNNALKKGPRF